MRGDDPRHESMFGYVTPEQRGCALITRCARFVG